MSYQVGLLISCRTAVAHHGQLKWTPSREDQEDYLGMHRSHDHYPPSVPVLLPRLLL